MKNINSMIGEAIKRGLLVSVFDGEEWAVKRSANKKEILEAINSVEEAQIRLRDAGGNAVGWALLIPSLEDDESIADYSDNALMNELCGI